MKSAFMSLALISMLSTQALAQDDAKSEDKKPDETESIKTDASYVIGRNIGESIVGQNLDVDVDILVSALKEALAGKESRLSEDEMIAVMQKLQQQMAAKAAEEAKAAAAANLKKGEAFLLANGKKEGVMTTKSGLQYRVVKKGDGASPLASDEVTVHYEGRLINNKVFDSSIKRGQPATFPVNGVIKGWTEALQLMKEGAEYELYIPAELAYGTRGAGQDLGPNEVLIFKVSLIKVKKAGE